MDMDPQQILAQATAIATVVPIATPAPIPPAAPALFPPEVGYIITAFLGAAAALVVNRFTHGWQRRDMFTLEEKRANREEQSDEERRYREWRRDIEQKQERIEREFDRQLHEINIAILRLERSVKEIDEYIDPIRDAVRLNIRRKLQDDVISS